MSVVDWLTAIFGRIFIPSPPLESPCCGYVNLRMSREGGDGGYAVLCFIISFFFLEGRSIEISGIIGSPPRRGGGGGRVELRDSEKFIWFGISAIWWPGWRWKVGLGEGEGVC